MDRTIVLDVRLPFRHKKDLESKTSEAEAMISKFKELKEDSQAKDAWAKLLKDHDVDDVWFQVRRQDPRHPLKHQKPHLERGLKTTAPPADPRGEPEERTGQSGLLVATVHFPKRSGAARDEDQAARDTTDFLIRLENILGQRGQEHAQAYGYRAVSARGEEYDDLKAVKHNSICCGCDGGCGGSDLGTLSVEPQEPQDVTPWVES